MRRKTLRDSLSQQEPTCFVVKWTEAVAPVWRGAGSQEYVKETGCTNSHMIPFVQVSACPRQVDKQGSHLARPKANLIISRQQKWHVFRIKASSR